MGDGADNSGQVVLQSDIRHSTGKVISPVCPSREKTIRNSHVFVMSSCGSSSTKQATH